MARDLNHRLELEERARTPDGAGGFIEDWRPLGTLWGEMRSGAGRTRGDDLTASSEVPYRIIVRGAPFGAPSRPRAGQRFRMGHRLFRIEAVAESEPDGRYLTCFTHEELVL